jgi:SAM-dependent methyltransferase
MSEHIHKQNVKYYDAEAAVYDSVRYGDIAGQRAHDFHVRVLDRLLFDDLAAESSVLEFGCGTGRFLPHAGKHAQQVTGLDVSPGMIEKAQEAITKSHSNNVSLQLYDGNSIPLESNSIDGVYSILVLNLIPDFQQAFNEIARIIRPGGTFVFNLPNLFGVYLPAGLYVNLRGKTRTANTAGHRHSHWFAPSEWKSALTKSGFTLESVLGEPPHVRKVSNASPLNAQGPGLLLSKSVFVRAKLA